MTSYQIATDSCGSIPCEASETFLHAMLRASMGVAYECSSGFCGSCRFDLIEGEVATIWQDAPGLTERDRRCGNRHLACQSYPRSDCSVKIRFNDAYKARIRPDRLEARVIGSRQVAVDMIELAVAIARPAQFLPGQYMVLESPSQGARRVYSMSNLPNPDGHLHFIVKRKPGGALSEFLFNRVRVGDSITLNGPYGLAHLRSDVRRDILCIAGGSGLSPMLAIVRGALQSPAFGGMNINLFYGGRAAEDIVKLDAFADLAPARGHRLSFQVAASEPNDAMWDGERGFIHELVERSIGGDLKKFEIYIAGPPAMTKATLELLARYDVPAGQIHCDDFG